MDAPNKEFALAGSLEELKAKGRLVVHGAHRPILVIYDRGRVFALDNRCPHMGFPLERGSVEDGILTCHWHHARFDLESGCTFDLWADDVPICPVEVRNGEVWVKTTFDHADPGAHWHRRLADGLAHDLGLVIAKAVHGQLAADVPRADIVRQVAQFGAQNRDGWGVGLTILTALANLLVEPDARGDPMSSLRWTCKSLRRLAAELNKLGHQISHTVVGELLKAQKFSLQANRKTREGADNPDRDAQFGFHQRGGYDGHGAEPAGDLR